MQIFLLYFHQWDNGTFLKSSQWTHSSCLPFHHSFPPIMCTIHIKSNRFYLQPKPFPPLSLRRIFADSGGNDLSCLGQTKCSLRTEVTFGCKIMSKSIPNCKRFRTISTYFVSSIRWLFNNILILIGFMFAPMGNFSGNWPRPVLLPRAYSHDITGSRPRPTNRPLWNLKKYKMTKISFGFC